ncbi:MAG: hypothetical protein J2P20_08200, partial [Pseudonocardia sp.]|nr:hypothetical protein [Pseudonocardia sp.]
MDPFSATRTRRPRAARKAEFARFHDDRYPDLVALLHALHGDRAHAHRAAQRAFTDAWLRWRTLRSVPDPAAWVRRRARRMRPPRRPPVREAAAHEPEWITPAMRPIFLAMSELPEQERTVLALHHIGGLTDEQIATEEHLPLGAVASRLADAHQDLAQRMAELSPDAPGLPTPGPGRSATRATDAWAGRELANLAHALSYGTDRRAAEQVFRQAVRQRATLVTATAAVVSISGLGAALAVMPNPPGAPNTTSPPAGGPGMALPPPPVPDRGRPGPRAV